METATFCKAKPPNTGTEARLEKVARNYGPLVNETPKPQGVSSPSANEIEDANETAGLRDGRSRPSEGFRDFKVVTDKDGLCPFLRVLPTRSLDVAPMEARFDVSSRYPNMSAI